MSGARGWSGGVYAVEWCCWRLFVYRCWRGEHPQSPAPHRTTPYHTAPHRTTPYHTAPHRTTPYDTAPHRTTPYHTAPHRTTPHHTAPHRTTPHSPAPHTSPASRFALSERSPRPSRTPRALSDARRHATTSHVPVYVAWLSRVSAYVPRRRRLHYALSPPIKRSLRQPRGSCYRVNSCYRARSAKTPPTPIVTRSGTASNSPPNVMRRAVTAIPRNRSSASVDSRYVPDAVNAWMTGSVVSHPLTSSDTRYRPFISVFR